MSFGMDHANDLLRLNSLLTGKEDGSDDDGDMPESGPSTFTPAVIGAKKKSSATAKESSPYEKLAAGKDDIWNADEVTDISSWENADANTQQPEYDITYKQKVTSEDMFLGMSGKNPSSACCEEICVIIDLPGQLLKDIDLELKSHHLNCRSPEFLLHLPLPHPVDAKNGKAQWDAKSEKLKVTMTMQREYDFINF